MVQATAAGCWQADEVRAARVRDVQTELMVGALMCRADDRLIAHYNAFMGANSETFKHDSLKLKMHFMRTAGMAGGMVGYDRFVTTLANTQSEHARAMGHAFCDSAESIMEVAANATPAQLEELASAADQLPAGVVRCEGEGAPVRVAAMLPAPAPAVETVTTTTVEDVDVPADGAVPAALPVAAVAADPVVAPVPVAVTVPAPVVAPPAPMPVVAVAEVPRAAPVPVAYAPPAPPQAPAPVITARPGPDGTTVYTITVAPTPAQSSAPGAAFIPAVAGPFVPARAGN